MIGSWANEEARAIFEGRAPRSIPSDVLPKVRRLLAQLNAAAAIGDMKAPPGNRLHQLSGDLAGRWSVSVNMKYRITFRWGEDGPEEVWLGDYH